jgi:hypothetical protein
VVGEAEDGALSGGEGSIGITVVVALEVCGLTRCLPCAQVVAVAVTAPEASRVTDTVPGAVLMVAEPPPSLLMVAVAACGAEEAASAGAVFTL